MREHEGCLVYPMGQAPRASMLSHLTINLNVYLAIAHLYHTIPYTPSGHYHRHSSEPFIVKPTLQDTESITMATSIFTLPPELRLQMHAHLIKSCLATGEVGAVRGLLYSCHEISDELKINCLPNVQHLIENMVKWKAAHLDHSPLLLELPPNYELSKPPTEAAISIPRSKH
jgi:hypothetical protein